MSNKIAAVVVTYNRKQLLQENIQKLLDQTFSKFDILIIDNHSTDGTADTVKPFISDRLSYVDTGSNLGGAGGFQYGVREAANRGYEFVWLMDDDSMPEPDALRELVTAYRKIGGRIGFLSSKVIWTDGSPCKMNLQRRTLTRTVTDFSKRYIPAAMATFVSLFVPMYVVRDVGLPIREFFIWTDDFEYTRRISRKYWCYIVTKSVVVHKTNTNNGANISTDTEDRIDRYKYAYRNEVYLYRREGLRGIFHLLARTPLHIYRVLRYSKTKKLKRIGVILGSTLKGFTFNPPIEYVQKEEK